MSKINFQKYSNKPVTTYKYVTGVIPLLQNDYGEKNDCTITSITTVIKWLKPGMNTQNIYNIVEKIAKRYFYTGGYGTLNFTIKSIYQKSLKACGIDTTIKSKYLKNIGFTWTAIKERIDNNTPIILNLWKDGNNYYKNHTVLIIGYAEREDDLFLIVYDNWNKEMNYIDYNKLSTISSVQMIF